MLENIARAYGVTETFAGTTGTTGLNVPAVMTLAHEGQKIAIGRECHVSVIAGLYLSGAEPVYLMPPFNPDLGVLLPPSPAEVGALLDAHPDARAIVLTMPTYHGLMGDVVGIVGECHRRGVLVMVDGAHGPHFRFLREIGFPMPAEDAGADLVTQSTHKVLSALNQGSLLHLNNPALSPRYEEFQSMGFQSTSFSYPILISIEHAIEQMVTEGPETWAGAVERAGRLREGASRIGGVRIVDENIIDGRRVTAPACDAPVIEGWLLILSRSRVSVCIEWWPVESHALRCAVQRQSWLRGYAFGPSRCADRGHSARLMGAAPPWASYAVPDADARACARSMIKGLVMSDPKKHHYVPQSLLREFSIGGKRQHVVVFDKTRRTSFVSSIADAGCESYFNTVEVEGKRISFEGLFRMNDEALGRVLAAVTETHSLASLDQDVRDSLPEVAVAQLIRTKLSRTTMIDVAAQLRDTVIAAGIDSVAVDELGVPTDNDARLAALACYLGCARHIASLRHKDVILICAEADSPLWMSDHPVVIHNSFPYGELGLESPGVEIYMPISSQLALGFFCPSIGRRLSVALGSELPEHLREQSSTIRHGLSSGEAVSLGTGTSKFLNALQVHRSSRFLYAAGEGFELAQTILQREPQLREVQSLVTVGRLGHGPPRRPEMPRGRWLVVYGRGDHHMIRVDRWLDESDFIEFETSDLPSLSAATSDVPLVQAQLFEDGLARRHMREIRLEVTGDGPTRRVIVKHRDDGLNAILAAR